MRRKKARGFLLVLFFIISLRLVLPMTVFAGVQSKPETIKAVIEPGLAAKYPGDKNISQDADVIFATDFESGITGWTEFRNKSAITINKDPAIVCGDSACVQITAIHKKDEGGDLSFHLPVPQEQLYVRFYVRFHKDTFMAGHFVNMRALKLQPRFWPNAGSRPPGDKGYWSTICPPLPEKNETWRFYTYWHEMHSWQNEDGSPNNPPDGDGRSFYGNTFFPFKEPGKFEREKWYCVEFMLKANTPGKHDGEQAAWIDGEKIMHWKTGCIDGIWFRDRFCFSEDWIKNPKPFEGFNWRTDPNLKINIVNFQWWVPDYQSVESTNGICIVYFDDIVVAKKYIGPRVEKSS